MLNELAKTPDTEGVLERLQRISSSYGLADLADNLGSLATFLTAELAHLELEIDTVRQVDRSAERVSHRAGNHLLDLGGKRIRPICVLLASRIGPDRADREAVADLAVAVELVHNATLLHDDVIDGAPTRRGKPSARMVFGNAASIFAGDWLLIEALRRVQRAAVAGTMESLLDTIDEMIQAEALQLEQRGRLTADAELYFRIVEGKSATLFRWALGAGGRAAGLDQGQCAHLERFGAELGMAFQVVDDVLDLGGRENDTGKTLFADLREGKLTYPLLLALGRRPGLREQLQAIADVPLLDGGEAPDELSALCAKVLEVVRSTGALDEARAYAASRVERASAALGELPPGDAVAALQLVAASAVHRSR